MELSERLRAIRKRQGLTQKQLQERSGVPQNTISRIEIGQVQEIGTKTLTALARALQVTTDHLLGIDVEPPSQGTSQPKTKAKTKAKATSQPKRTLRPHR